jgi:holo-[acyl-carrier protein] synthase
MILGIGLDVVNVDRLRQWENKKGIFKRYFHESEIKAVEKKGSMKILSLAARFAAKEAYGKALGTGLKGFSLNEISVLNDENGKPWMKLYGKAKESLKKFGGRKILVSLTHEHDYALAMIVIEE